MIDISTQRGEGRSRIPMCGLDVQCLHQGNDRGGLQVDARHSDHEAHCGGVNHDHDHRIGHGGSQMNRAMMTGHLLNMVSFIDESHALAFLSCHDLSYSISGNQRIKFEALESKLPIGSAELSVYFDDL